MQWGVINNQDNLDEETYMHYIEKSGMYEWTYSMLLKLFKDKGKTDRIYEEINFCKQMHELRPRQWEIKKTQIKVLKPNTSKNKTHGKF